MDFQICTSLLTTKIYRRNLKFLFVALFSFGHFFVKGQTIHVFDLKDHEPISDVFVMHSKFTEISDANGSIRLAVELEIRIRWFFNILFQVPGPYLSKN
jgi:hypothetical protein